MSNSGSVDGNNQLIIKGKFQQKQIETVLRRYISEWTLLLVLIDGVGVHRMVVWTPRMSEGKLFTIIITTIFVALHEVTRRDPLNNLFSIPISAFIPSV